MSTLDKYLISSLKSLDHWLPRLQPQVPPRRDRRSRVSPPRAALPLEIPASGLALDSAGEAESSLSTSLSWPPSLAELLESLNEPPPYAALLGACEDGLPFLFNLSNPAPGAVLVTGDAAVGKTSLLRSVLHSACRMNSAEQLTFNVIASQPDEYLDLDQLEHCQAILPVEEQAAADLIAELVDTVETRKRNHPQDPAMILVIDDLAALLSFLDEQTFSRLYWLIRHGPRYQVWTLATLPSAQADQLDPRFLSAFRTRLFGYMHDERLAQRLAGDDGIATRDIERGRQFYVPYGGEWLRFWICKVDGITPGGVR
jgi:AAA ATPase domain